MKLPKISIIIPSFNKKDYIGHTLQSIIDQNYPNLEVIIRDGGSTDGTLAIIKKYTQKYPKMVSWMIKKGEGQSGAINQGLKRATGDILTYLNADDVYLKGALLSAGKYFSNHPKTLWLAGKGNIINEHEKEIAEVISSYKNILLSQNSYSLLLINNYLVQPSVFLSRSTFKKYGPFTGTDTSVMEYDLWLKLGKVEMPKILDCTLSSFRLVRGSISTSEFKKVLLADEKIVEKYTDNQVILMLHYLHNLGRVFTLK